MSEVQPISLQAGLMRPEPRLTYSKHQPRRPLAALNGITFPTPTKVDSVWRPTLPAQPDAASDDFVSLLQEPLYNKPRIRVIKAVKSAYIRPKPLKRSASSRLQENSPDWSANKENRPPLNREEPYNPLPPFITAQKISVSKPMSITKLEVKTTAVQQDKNILREKPKKKVLKSKPNPMRESRLVPATFHHDASPKIPTVAFSEPDQVTHDGFDLEDIDSATQDLVLETRFTPVKQKKASQYDPSARHRSPVIPQVAISRQVSDENEEEISQTVEHTGSAIATAATPANKKVQFINTPDVSEITPQGLGQSTTAYRKSLLKGRKRLKFSRVQSTLNKLKQIADLEAQIETAKASKKEKEVDESLDILCWSPKRLGFGDNKPIGKLLVERPLHRQPVPKELMEAPLCFLVNEWWTGHDSSQQDK